MSAEQLIQSAVAHHQAGRLLQAEELYRQVLQEVPHHPDAQHLSGIVALQRGNADSALELIRGAIKANPAIANYHFSLGNALQAKGQLEEALAGYRQAILLKPNYTEAYSNKGHVLQTLGRLDEAVTSCQQAIQINPGYIEAYNNLGSALQAQGRHEEAIAHYRHALLLKPDYVDACNNLGATLKSLNRLDEAAASYRQALSIKPDCAEAHSNLGNVLKLQGRFDEAVASFQQALLIKPDFTEAYSNLGNAYLTKCDLDEAVACYRQALLIKPDYADAHSNLIFTLDLTLGIDTPTLQAERQRWSAVHAAALLGTPSFANLADPDRRLRIGYVSADIKRHSAAVVFGAMLTCFDPAAFDVFAYSNSGNEDECTQLFRQSVTGWRNIIGLTDAAVADLIRQDAIDILVDLSGHSGGNRLLVFARKPAPIQITAWGYIGGTGMKAMDVFFADTIVVPPEEKHFFAEEIRYLPNAVSAFFPSPFPAVNDLPALSAKAVTFGSFNRLCKVSAEAFQTWTQVLRAIPSSRMVLKTGELNDAGTRERITGQFIQAGVDPERILLLGGSTWQDHVANFNRIDISLDPFPHGGGVTALEGLMMGVPAVTLRWPTIPGRVSASIMTTLGLTDWIAETPEQYVEIAVRKAQDLTALAELRQQLRPRFMASIIGDTTAYARLVEQEYRKLWREWCRNNL